MIVPRAPLRGQRLLGHLPFAGLTADDWLGEASVEVNGITVELENTGNASELGPNGTTGLSCVATNGEITAGTEDPVTLSIDLLNFPGLRRILKHPLIRVEARIASGGPSQAGHEVVIRSRHDGGINYSVGAYTYFSTSIKFGDMRRVQGGRSNGGSGALAVPGYFGYVGYGTACGTYGGAGGAPAMVPDDEIESYAAWSLSGTPIQLGNSHDVRLEFLKGGATADLSVVISDLFIWQVLP